MIRMFFTNDLIRHHYLISRLLSRELVAKYRGSLLGTAWVVLLPVILLGMYTLVFSGVFQLRWGDDTDAGSYALTVFAGIIFHFMLAEALQRGPTTIIGNPSYVKKIAFPLPVLVWASVGASCVTFVVSYLILIGFVWLVQGSVPVSALYVPWLLIPFSALCAGLHFALAAVGTYLRDVAQLTTVLTMMFLFFSPIFYPVDALPPGLQDWMWLNPLAFYIESTRAFVLGTELPPASTIVGVTAASFCVAQAGYLLFSRLSDGFADVV